MSRSLFMQKKNIAEVEKKTPLATMNMDGKDQASSDESTGTLQQISLGSTSLSGPSNISTDHSTSDTRQLSSAQTPPAAAQTSSPSTKPKVGGRKTTGIPNLRVSTASTIIDKSYDMDDDEDEPELFVVRIKVPDGRCLTTAVAANANVLALKRSLAPMLMLLPVPVSMATVCFKGQVIKDSTLISDIPGLVSGRDCGLKLVLPDELPSPKGKIQRCMKCDRYMSNTCISCGNMVCLYCNAGSRKPSIESDPTKIFSPTSRSPTAIEEQGTLPSATAPSPRTSLQDTATLTIECSKCASMRVDEDVKAIRDAKLRSIIMSVMVVLCTLGIIVIIFVVVKGPKDEQQPKEAPMLNFDIDLIPGSTSAVVSSYSSSSQDTNPLQKLFVSRTNGSADPKVVEAVLCFLFNKMDPDATKEMFRHCWPILERSQSREFRNVATKALETMKKDGRLSSNLLIRKSMFEECRGERYDQAMLALSTAALKAVMERDYKHFMPAVSKEVFDSKEKDEAKVGLLERELNSLSEAFLAQCDERDHLQDEWANFGSEMESDYFATETAIAQQQQLRHHLREQVSVVGRKQVDLDELQQTYHEKIQSVHRLWSEHHAWMATNKENMAAIEALFDGKYPPRTVSSHDVEVKVPPEVTEEFQKLLKQGSVLPLYDAQGNLDLISVMSLFQVAISKFEGFCQSELLEDGGEKLEQNVSNATENLAAFGKFNEDMATLRWNLNGRKEKIQASVEELRSERRILQDPHYKRKGSHVGLAPETPRFRMDRKETQASKKLPHKTPLRSQHFTAPTPQAISDINRSIKPKPSSETTTAKGMDAVSPSQMTLASFKTPAKSVLQTVQKQFDAIREKTASPIALKPKNPFPLRSKAVKVTRNQEESTTKSKPGPSNAVSTVSTPGKLARTKPLDIVADEIVQAIVADGGNKGGSLVHSRTPSAVEPASMTTKRLKPKAKVRFDEVQAISDPIAAMDKKAFQPRAEIARTPLKKPTSEKVFAFGSAVKTPVPKSAAKKYDVGRTGGNATPSISATPRASSIRASKSTAATPGTVKKSGPRKAEGGLDGGIKTPLRGRALKSEQAELNQKTPRGRKEVCGLETQTPIADDKSRYLANLLDDSESLLAEDAPAYLLRVASSPTESMLVEPNDMDFMDFGSNRENQNILSVESSENEVESLPTTTSNSNENLGVQTSNINPVSTSLFDESLIEQKGVGTTFLDSFNVWNENVVVVDTLGEGEDLDILTCADMGGLAIDDGEECEEHNDVPDEAAHDLFVEEVKMEKSVDIFESFKPSRVLDSGHDDDIETVAFRRDVDKSVSWVEARDGALGSAGGGIMFPEISAVSWVRHSADESAQVSGGQVVEASSADMKFGSGDMAWLTGGSEEVVVSGSWAVRTDWGNADGRDGEFHIPSMGIDNLAEDEVGLDDELFGENAEFLQDVSVINDDNFNI
ncbi:hypothetical protein HDU76_008820 [Blyttiomyces sp. JEL0837]|nr:hypothetical protein HDU76_008820 [Blyttiomyces sp. JEL0837]